MVLRSFLGFNVDFGKLYHSPFHNRWGAKIQWINSHCAALYSIKHFIYSGSNPRFIEIERWGVYQGWIAPFLHEIYFMILMNRLLWHPSPFKTFSKSQYVANKLNLIPSPQISVQMASSRELVTSLGIPICLFGDPITVFQVD